MAEAKPLRLLLGFDYGSKQIGVAVGQVITGQARELCILKAQNGVPDWQKVEALIKATGQRLREGQSGGYRERPVDAIAAALLLQGWLEENCLG